MTAQHQTVVATSFNQAATDPDRAEPDPTACTVRGEEQIRQLCARGEPGFSLGARRGRAVGRQADPGPDCPGDPGVRPGCRAGRSRPG